MKLYYHPVSTTCRPIVHFAADSGITLDLQVVDLFKGEHLQTRLTPLQRIAALVDEAGHGLTNRSQPPRLSSETITFLPPSPLPRPPGWPSALMNAEGLTLSFASTQGPVRGR